MRQWSEFVCSFSGTIFSLFLPLSIGCLIVRYPGKYDVDVKECCYDAGNQGSCSTSKSVGIELFENE